MVAHVIVRMKPNNAQSNAICEVGAAVSNTCFHILLWSVMT